ncbi:MAG: pitrilysin family protein [Fibrobacterota bacterium]
MLKHLFPLLLFTVLLRPAPAQSPQAQLVDAREHRLQNGLKVLIVEDKSAPQVVCRLYFKVGSTYENIGKTGLSHMLEHMMFKGTKKVGVIDFAKEQVFVRPVDSLFRLSDAALDRGDTVAFTTLKQQAVALTERQRVYMKNNELWGLYQKEGGTDLNAWTGDFMTAYIVTLPSNKLELFCWLESDRMANPVMREFYTERDVVMEERRLRYENSPYGRYWESLSGLVFEAHPYRIPTIGTMGDVRHLTMDDAFGHFKRYYTPNNALLVLAGDLREKEALALVTRYFGLIPRGPEVTGPLAFEPEQAGLKRITVKKDVGPRLDVLYKTPALGEKESYAFDIVEGVLSGKSGRLYKRLVLEKKLATSVSASHQAQKWVSLLTVSADLVQGADPAAAERVVLDEIAKLRDSLVTDHELEKVKNNVTAAQVNGLRTNEMLSDRLAYFEICGSWKLINRYADEVKAATPVAVREAARKYLAEKSATVGWVVNEGKGGAK